jgi:hypothetical protein
MDVGGGAQTGSDAEKFGSEREFVGKSGISF